MALIYKLTFPSSIFTTARENEGVTPSPSGNVITSTGRELPLSLFRDMPTFASPYVIPKEDIASADLKVKLVVEENKSKVAYRVSFIGQTARDIVAYLKYIRLPGGSTAYPQPIEGIEYLFHTDKQIAINITDTCCPVTIDGRGSNRQVIQGQIPLNTINYCEQNGCSVDCTIYEDTKRTDAIACIESTVLGLRSNIGFLSSAEIHSDNKFQAEGFDSKTQFARVKAKWFDMCIEPQSTGIALILTSLIGVLKVLILSAILPIFATLTVLVLVINTIITAINFIPGINISLVSFQPLDFALNLLDDLFGLERVVEGIYGCKYVRGGYTVRSILAATCSICGFSTEKYRDSFLFNTDNDNFSNVKAPITANGFIETITDTGVVTPLTNRTAYIPAETSYKRNKEDNIRRDYNNASTPNKLKVLRDVAIRAASIETTDKILSRLGSLWGTGWDVVNTPISPDTPEGLQLQLGSIDTRYSFQDNSIIRLDAREDGDFPNLFNVDICYEVGEGIPVGYETNFKSDSSDLQGNKQLKSYRGYVSYSSPESKDRKLKRVKKYDVDFASTNFIGAKSDETIYDDLVAERVRPFGFSQIEDFFDKGVLVMGSETTSEPKIMQFRVGSARVIDSGKACKLDYDNQFLLGATRMSDTTNTTITTDLSSPLLTPAIQQTKYKTGIQTLLPYFTVGYRCDITSSSVDEARLEPIISSLLSIYGSSEFGYSEALNLIRTGGDAVAGVLNNLINESGLMNDGTGNNFTSLLDFSFEKENFECQDEELFLECVINANVKQTYSAVNDSQDYKHGYRLRLIKLTLGLGVITSIEIDYDNRTIKGQGYVIPFFQNGVNYNA